jgi:hypothetical protein
LQNSEHVSINVLHLLKVVFIAVKAALFVFYLILFQIFRKIVNAVNDMNTIFQNIQILYKSEAEKFVNYFSQIEFDDVKLAVPFANRQFSEAFKCVIVFPAKHHSD